LGLSGRVPGRVDAATKAGLLDLLDDALEAGWSLRRSCHVLELSERRAHRWYGRRALGQLLDRKPGGTPVHGLLPEEAEQILALFEEWGETDRSHRKLAHRGSYLARVWVSPSSVRRVLHLADKHFRPLPRPGRSVRKQFPDWVQYRPNSIWIYDTTHFTAAAWPCSSSRTWSPASGSPRSSQVRRPPRRWSWRSPPRSSSKGSRSGRRPA
jgi:putative transposase